MISYVPLTFFGIIAAVGLGFFVHGFVNRQKIFAAFNDLASRLSGAAGRSAIWSYPYLSGTFEGRPVKIFFHTAENHTVSVLNLVVEMGVSTPDKVLLLQKDGFREPKPEQKAKLEEEVGSVVPVTGIPFDVRSPEPGRAGSLLASPELAREISSLTAYNQILLWDGSLIASKQFEGVAETLPEAMMSTLSRLLSLAGGFEERHAGSEKIGAQTA
ncbi:MAG: hypothetical protein M1537_08020 [Nitrospirae bacterium]|nr:MAG: hypothetical protein D084_Lepto4C00287G0002 [Leptospirillum sp. Group IV 'UBA BS']MCL4486252.1 hypothetical protein [Nitrospirota bacterium]MCL5284907.1 hypothetical protein [Nitrospirota bacterium]